MKGKFGHFVQKEIYEQPESVVYTVYPLVAPRFWLSLPYQALDLRRMPMPLCQLLSLSVAAQA
jgi:hypothetical protein